VGSFFFLISHKQLKFNANVSNNAEQLFFLKKWEVISLTAKTTHREIIPLDYMRKVACDSDNQQQPAKVGSRSEVVGSEMF